MAGIVMDTATFAHPNATPRTLAVSAALVAAGAPLSDISRRLVPNEAGRAAPPVRAGAGPAGDPPDRRLIWSTLRRPISPTTEAIPAHSEGIIDLLAQSETAEVSMLFKEQDRRTTRLSVRTKPGGVDATVLTGTFGRRRPCARGRCHDRAAPGEAAGARCSTSPSAWRPRSAR